LGVEKHKIFRLSCEVFPSPPPPPSSHLPRLTSYDRYYTYAVIRSGGIPILLSVLAYPSQLRNSLPNLSVLDNDIPTIPSTSSTSGSHVDSGTDGDSGSGTTTPSVATSSKSLDVNTKKHILHEQLWLNCATILHNLSFSHMAKKVMHLLSATDGYLIMCNCLRLCREKILLLSFTTTPSASTSSSNLSLIFRKIALARTSTCLTQVIPPLPPLDSPSLPLDSLKLCVLRERRHLG
jgi:hypothetical protein